MDCELIVALDLESREEVLSLLSGIAETRCWVKIGLQLFTRYGPSLVHEVAGMGFPVFLDLKLHDIPNTVAKSVESLASLPIRMLTLHASGGSEMMAAAAQAAAKWAPELMLLGVTVLTSLDDDGLLEIGIEDRSAVQVLRLARLAQASGIRGLVCSPLEVALIREEFPSELTLVTPGIRPGGSSHDEQKRVATPAQAKQAGSSFIVVGRPVLQAPHPAQAIAEIRRELSTS